MRCPSVPFQCNGAALFGNGASRFDTRLPAFVPGGLDPALSDPSVDEVMVNGPGAVYVERHGKLERAGIEFG